MGTLHAIAPPDGARKDNASDADLQFRHTRSLAAKQRGDTRSAIIWCGTELLTERGFQITGIDEILSIVGVPKGSFYYYFKSKREFGVAVVDNYVEFYAQKMSLLFDNPERTPLQRLQDFVDDGKLGMAKYNFKRGCLIGNMGQELAALNDEFRERLELVMQAWEARVTALFQLARENGDIAQSHDPESLSQFFWIGWEGAILRSKLTRSVAPLDRFAQIFFGKVLGS
jgi:TetR/AcrR family transcriptional repressor of nem operon